MENLNIEQVNKNIYVEKINQLDREYKGKSLFPTGSVENISYADLGKTLSIRLTGDVPTNFLPAEVVIVHPSSEKDGWIGKGNIGFILEGSGVDISKIPLPEDSIKMIKEIYQKYTDKDGRIAFYMENNVNKFAQMGLFNEIVSKK